MSYGIVVGLISVLAIVSVTSLGNQVKTTFTETSDTLSGQMITAVTQDGMPGASPFATGGTTRTTGEGSGTSNPGTVNNYPNQIAFEYSGTDTINYQVASANPGEEIIVDFGDGTPPQSIFNTQTYSFGNGNVYHTYTTPGTYIMTISGPVTYMEKKNYGDTPLTDVLSFGNTLINTRSLFAQEQDLASVPALPPSLINIERMFESANMDGITGYAGWNLDNVERVDFLFTASSGDLADLTVWDVSGVTYCGYFNYAASNMNNLRPNFTSCSPN